jgi:hypothetical protein
MKHYDAIAGVPSGGAAANVVCRPIPTALVIWLFNVCQEPLLPALPPSRARTMLCARIAPAISGEIGITP